jgi:hypothetical protein
MMSGTAPRTLNEATMTESGLNPECLIEIRWNVASAINVELHISRRPCRLSRPVETGRNEAGKRCSCRDCSKARLQAGPGFLPSVQVFHARKTDEMSLEAVSCFGANVPAEISGVIKKYSISPSKGSTASCAQLHEVQQKSSTLSRTTRSECSQLLRASWLKRQL